MKNYIHFEHLSVLSDIGITVLDRSGITTFESSVTKSISDFIQLLYKSLDCEESSRITLLYGCYQSRRFGGRYIFFAPSGLVYCAVPLDHKGEMSSGVIAGPFLMTDHDDYIDCDIKENGSLSESEIAELSKGVQLVPYISPKQAHALNEHLYNIASTYYSEKLSVDTVPLQIDLFASTYPIEKEDQLLTAIRKGDIHTANNVLDEIMKQILSHYGGNIEVLRSRVVELTVLLSRAALKGGADITLILGMNYDYLGEIDSLSSVEDIVLWLYNVTQRFTKHVFDFSDVKDMNIIYKAVEFIKLNYAEKLTLRDIADHLFISKQYFCRIFKESTGQTPGDYITFVRVEESKKQLRNSDIKIVDIPELVGFSGQSYFTKVFKKNTGLTPGQYRRENINLK